MVLFLVKLILILGGEGGGGGGGRGEGVQSQILSKILAGLYLLNWMRHCFQIFTVCRPHKGLPVCWILKPSVIYVISYGHLWYFHWSSRNFKNISLWAFRFGIQIVLGVPYNILKFEADMINTLGEIDIQNLGPPPPPHLVKGSIVQKNFKCIFNASHDILSIFQFLPPPPPPVNRRTETLKT